MKSSVQVSPRQSGGGSAVLACAAVLALAGPARAAPVDPVRQGLVAAIGCASGDTAVGISECGRVRELAMGGASGKVSDRALLDWAAQRYRGWGQRDPEVELRMAVAYLQLGACDSAFQLATEYLDGGGPSQPSFDMSQPASDRARALLLLMDAENDAFTSRGNSGDFGAAFDAADQSTRMCYADYLHRNYLSPAWDPLVVSLGRSLSEEHLRALAVTYGLSSRGGFWDGLQRLIDHDVDHVPRVDDCDDNDGNNQRLKGDPACVAASPGAIPAEKGKGKEKKKETATAGAESRVGVEGAERDPWRYSDPAVRTHRDPGPVGVELLVGAGWATRGVLLPSVQALVALHRIEAFRVSLGLGALSYHAEWDEPLSYELQFDDGQKDAEDPPAIRMAAEDGYSRDLRAWGIAPCLALTATPGVGSHPGLRPLLATSASLGASFLRDLTGEGQHGWSPAWSWEGRLGIELERPPVRFPIAAVVGVVQPWLIKGIGMEGESVHPAGATWLGLQLGVLR